MGCKQCSGKPSVPYVRAGLPTVYAWGPFLDHQVVDYAELGDHGYILEEEQES